MFSFSGKNKKQLEAVFNWLSEAVNQQDLILLEQKGKQEIYFFEFPLKYGDKPKKTKNYKEEDISFFVNFSSRRPDLGEDWLPVFKSPDLEIYEKKKKFSGSRAALNWKLANNEKKSALEIARRSLELFLKNQKYPDKEDVFAGVSLTQIFDRRVDLDIALWVNGEIRGSCMLENNLLGEGIIMASILAARDLRFKPLDAEDLPFARIEITLFPDLKIPVSQGFIEKNEILYNKGYLIKRGEKKGWFLPEVFNILLFKNLKDFILRLGQEKALLRKKEVFDEKAKLFIFEVDDFIEDEGKMQPLELDGPIVANRQEDLDIEKPCRLAADWLLRTQEEDGNFPPIINPLMGKISQIDWPRSALVAWSLIELGNTLGETAYIGAGIKSFFYFEKHILDESLLLDLNKKALSLCYLGQAGLCLGNEQDALKFGSLILEKEEQLKFEPIAFLQIGSFFAELSKKNNNFLKPALKFFDICQKNFEDNLINNKSISLAAWAEILNLSIKLFDILHEQNYLEAAKKACELFFKNQLDCGAFKGTADSDFVNVRGTGKIAEVLASLLILKNNEIDSILSADYYKKCLKKAFNWLLKMQYSAQNSYFIPKKNLDYVIGGFRHDYFNQELWIDSAGHFILAGARYLRLH